MHKWILIAVAGLSVVPVEAALVPEGAVIPKSFEHSLFRLRPLTQEYAKADFEAVVASRAALRQLFDGDWPGEGFSLADNRRDIAEHEALSLAREAFTYTVLDPAGLRVLGCVYIVPAQSPDFDAAYLYWLRTGEEALEPEFAAALAQWLGDAWPFDEVQRLR